MGRVKGKGLRHILLISLAVVVLVLGFAGTALAGEVNDVFLVVEVRAIDPSNPGQTLPVGDMWINTQGNLILQSLKTGPEGLATFAVRGQGQVIVSLDTSLDPNLPPWAGYRLDTHETMVIVGKSTITHLTLTLVPKAPGDDGTTGGVRIQKLYYPYPYGVESANIAMSNLLVFNGPEVAGARFIVAQNLNEPGLPETWLAPDGTFTATIDEAKRFETGEDGQVVIDGLEPGDYLVYEVEAAVGSPVEGLRLQAFTVTPGLITGIPWNFSPSPFINDEPGYSVLVEKADADTGELLSGAEFVVYRFKADGTEEYLDYRLPPQPGAAILPTYTDDPAQAYVFTGNTHTLNPDAFSAWLYAKGHFLVRGLEPGVEYYLREVKAPEGYQAQETDLLLDEALKLTLDGIMNNAIEPLVVVNHKPQGTQVFTKYLEDPWQPGVPEGPLPGAQFILYKAETTTGPQGEVQTQATLLTGGGTVPGDALVFAPQAFHFEAAYQDYLAGLPADADPNQALLGFAQSLNPAPVVFITTSPYGTLAIHGLPENSDGQVYVLHEISAPPGISPQASLAFTLVDGQVVPVGGTPEGLEPTAILNSQAPGSLFIKKVETTGSAPIPNVDFRLFLELAENGENVRYYLTGVPQAPTPAQPNPPLPLSAANDVDSAFLFTTDELGRAFVPNLPYQDENGADLIYHVEEKEAPPGFLMDFDSAQYFSLSEPYFNSALLIFTNARIPPARVDLPATKEVQLFDGTSLPLSDFEPFTFEVLFRDQVIGTLHNDETGKIIFDDVWIDTSTLTQEDLLNPTTLTIREVVQDPPQPGIIYDDREYVVPVIFTGPLLDRLHEPPVTRGAQAGAVSKDSPFVTNGVFAIQVMHFNLELDMAFVNIYTPTGPFVIEKRFEGVTGYDKPIGVDLLQQDADGAWQLYQRVWLDGVPDPAAAQDENVPGEYVAWKYRFMDLPSHTSSIDPQTGETIFHTTKYKFQEYQTPAGFESSVIMNETGNILVNRLIPKPTPTPTKPNPVTDPPAPAYDPISVPLMANKTLVGGRLKAGEFTFILKDGAGREIERKTNATDGLVTFTPRRFSRTGTFLYTIVEVAGTREGMRYDPTVYTVKIVVTAVKQSLQARVDILKDGTPYSGTVAFTNRQAVPQTGDATYSTLMTLGAVAALTLLGAVLLPRLARRKQH